MCLAIVKPKNKNIPFAHFRRGFIRNPHGCGYVFAKDGQLITKKGFFSLAEFWESYKQDVTDDLPALIHFRWANVSIQNETNCHPWKINDDLSMIHNGTIAGYTDFRNGLSDTGNFTQMVLTPLFSANPNLWNEKHFSGIMSRSIGFNKIAILSRTGEFTIYNEGLGLWVNGVWYSNNDIRKLPKKRSGKKKSALTVESVA